MSQFKKAIRSKVYLKLGLMGPSGSGKTYSALLLAKGLAEGGRIAAIDTENRSMSLYAGLTEFDVLDIEAPFVPKKVIDAIREAASDGYKVLVIDSATHFWKYILDYKESLDRGGGNSYTNWGKAKPLFEEFKTAMLQAPIHVVCCIRAKDEYVIEKNERGKDAPRKVGMGAILEPGAEYEYTTVFEVSMDHTVTASKDRTSMFDTECFKITPETGKRFVKWLEGAESQEYVQPAATGAPNVPQERSQSAPEQPKPGRTGEPKEMFKHAREWLKSIGLSTDQAVHFINEAKAASLNWLQIVWDAQDQEISTQEGFVDFAGSVFTKAREAAEEALAESQEVTK